MSNVIVLGAGMVGSAIALDMARNHTVTLADLSRDALDRTGKKNTQLKNMSLKN